MSSIGSTSGSTNSPTFTMDGLASGLNTTQIIDQLMQIEARPQLLMQIRQQSYTDKITAWGNITTKLAAIKTLSDQLADPTQWDPITAASSDVTMATVSASSASTTGSVSFKIKSLAVAHTIASSGLSDLATTPIVSGSTVTINGHATTVGGGGTLQDVVNAINGDSGATVTASAVQVSTNSYRLQLTAKTAGQAITLDNSSEFGSMVPDIQVAAPSLATIHVGGDALGTGYDITSSTNSFQGVLAGVTINVLNADPNKTVTISTAPDSNGLADRVQKMVDSVNGLMAEVRTQTAYDATAKKAAPLLGEGAVSQVMQAVQRSMTDNIGTTGAINLGLSIDRDGNVTFDKTAFLNAYQKDPAGTTALFTTGGATQGLAARLSAQVDAATNSSTGYITSTTQGEQASVTTLQTSIDSYQIVLDNKREALRKVYASLETSLQQLKSQGSWLSGQLAGLSSSGG